MEKVKLVNIKTGIVQEVDKRIASDFIGTHDFKPYEEKKIKEPIEEKKRVFKHEL